MKQPITKELISNRINKYINEIVKENLENENHALDNLYSMYIYQMFESVDKYFSFWKTIILQIAKAKIEKIENYCYKNNLLKDSKKIANYIAKYYK